MPGARATVAEAPERTAIDRGWYYLIEPDDGQHAPPPRIRARGGRILTRRLVGWPGRIVVEDSSGAGLHPASLLRAASAAGRALEAHGAVDPQLTIRLGPAGTIARLEEVLHLDGPALAALPSPHPLQAQLRALLAAPLPAVPHPPSGLPAQPTRRVLFFESLMNTDMPHNDRELSQGVLHMVSALQGSEPVFARAKMPISGSRRGVTWTGPMPDLAGVGLVCLTLLEGYFEGVVELIAAIRARGCRAHIAVGGVMPSLSPAHVAAHLPGVTAICRGAGEYFVPRLAAIFGDGGVDTPLTPAQRHALAALDGVLILDAAGKALISGGLHRIVDVASLDAVPLALSHLQARHIEGGIEISTSRGCLHRCSFCTILGRERYQARSAGSVISLLQRYENRFRDIYGESIPPGAYRVHISDDDFACDRQRAIDFLDALAHTPFRLSSLQVSIADLCQREDGRLLAALDPTLLAALHPARFADHGKPIPRTEHLNDQHHRRWSSFLQIGVETFSERELVRLGKGYQVAHIRAAVDALCRRGIHLDAYFIASNTQTTAADLVDSTMELCRLKLRYPLHFHVRFPIVPHLVSYFPAATHRRKIRQGQGHTMALRGHLAVPGHSEFDYPLVAHDLPADPWVAAAVDSDFLTDAKRYTDSLINIRDAWMARTASLPPGPERQRGERLCRQLDDAPRRLIFELLQHSRRGAAGWPSSPDADHAMQTATELLGPPSDWLRAFSRYASQGAARMVVIPTWQCELRCRYCYIPKQDGRVMPPAVLDRSIDLLMSSSRPALTLQFFGGEALLEYGLVQQGILQATAQAQALGKQLSIILSSNGWGLDEEKLTWLARFPVKLELSLDGDRETMASFRRAWKGGDSYAAGIPDKAEMIAASGLPCDVIMVVHPLNVHKMPANFWHIAALGFSRIQINFTLGARWSAAQQQRFARGLFAIGRELRRRQAAGQPITMVNLESRPVPVLLNGEVTVDHDGTIYGGNAFLHETKRKARFVVGHLDELRSFDRYWLDAPTNAFLLEHSYPADITENNLAVGRIMTSFCRWMRGEQPAAAP